MATAALVREQEPPRPAAPERDARLGAARATMHSTRRWVVAAVALTILLVIGAMWHRSPIEMLGAGSQASAPAASLRLPPPYVALSPLCELYDALTLLTLGQHAALLSWLLATCIAARTAMRLRRSNVRQRGVHVDGLLLLAVLFAFVGVYVIGAVVPRPMAALVLADRDELAVDIHSHTSASHDGRIGFDAEANRRWHAAAGFAVAYITDHRTFDGAIAGARGNPRHAGDGTVLLSGIESAAVHSRLNILGADQSSGLDQHGRANLSRLASDTNVVVVLTTPASLGAIPATTPLAAVEISDGAPRGLMFTRRLAPEIGRFARARGLTRVAGSNNHGWGRTASAWTVLRIPGWRAMTPASLDSAIRGTLRHRGSSVRVIARGSTPLPRSRGALVATPALLAWSVVTRLSGAERVSWLLWIWSVTALAIVVAARRTRRRPGGAPPLPNGGASSAARAPRSPARARRAPLPGR